MYTFNYSASLVHSLPNRLANFRMNCLLLVTTSVLLSCFSRRNSPKFCLVRRVTASRQGVLLSGWWTIKVFGQARTCNAVYTAHQHVLTSSGQSRAELSSALLPLALPYSFISIGTEECKICHSHNVIVVMKLQSVVLCMGLIIYQQKKKLKSPTRSE